MRMDESLKPKKVHKPILRPGVLVGIGVTFIVLGVLALGLSLWEGFWGGGRIHMIQVPGFHELNLSSPGLYSGVYQHRQTGVLPAKELASLDVRILSKGDYEEVPVLMNTAGQAFERFGVQGMPVFNFLIEKSGTYTMSAVYPGDGQGPTVSLYVIPQSAQNIKQTLLVGIVAFLLLLSAGILAIVKRNKWAVHGI